MLRLIYARLVVGCCSAIVAGLAGPVCAQTYPERPVRVVVAMGAGGAADLLTRTITPGLSERLGQQFVVADRPGANGVLGQKAAGIMVDG